MRVYLNRMRRRGSISSSFLLCLAGVQFTACSDIKEMPRHCEPIPYERQVCYFSVTPTIDGTIEPDIWQMKGVDPPWETVDSTLCKKETQPENDKDASFQFACLADENFIYFGFRVIDETWWVKDPPDAGYSEETEDEYSGFHNEDSIEIIIDADISGTNNVYDERATMIFLKAGRGINAMNTVTVGESIKAIIGGTSEEDGLTFGTESGANGFTKRTDKGWDAEIRIPLKGRGIQPYDEQVIGFHTGYNDNDDEGSRDHKLIWGKSDRGYESENEDDNAYRDPSHLDRLEFCNIQKDAGD